MAHCQRMLRYFSEKAKLRDQLATMHALCDTLDRQVNEAQAETHVWRTAYDEQTRNLELARQALKNVGVRLELVS